MDLVYIVRNGDENNELLYSLRSVQKFVPSFNNIVIVGYKPEWINNDNIIYIPTHQRRIKSSWENARNNFLTACKSSLISDDFILMNDDFIATRPIRNWNESLSKVKNSIKQQIKEWEELNIKSRYTDAFVSLADFLKDNYGIKTPMNYELHIPMVINKKKALELFSKPEVQEFIDNNYVSLYRSLYGNYYNIEYNAIINDVKFYNVEPAEITTEWISVFDGWINNHRRYPRLNRFLFEKLNKKSIYEN